MPDSQVRAHVSRVIHICFRAELASLSSILLYNSSYCLIPRTYLINVHSQARVYEYVILVQVRIGKSVSCNQKGREKKKFSSMGRDWKSRTRASIVLIRSVLVLNQSRGFSCRTYSAAGVASCGATKLSMRTNTALVTCTYECSYNKDKQIDVRVRAQRTCSRAQKA